MSAFKKVRKGWLYSQLLIGKSHFERVVTWLSENAYPWLCSTIRCSNWKRDERLDDFSLVQEPRRSGGQSRKLRLSITTSTLLTVFALLLFSPEMGVAQYQSNTPIANYTFSDGGLDGWAPFGSAALTNVVSPIADPAGETHSLLVSNRTADDMGPSLNVLNINGVEAGATYQVTAYVLLAQPDSSNPNVSFATQNINCANTSGSDNTISAAAQLSNTAWTKVSGTFTYSDVPGPPSSLLLYLQSSSATDSFYLSDATITEIAPAPNPSQQDNSGISSTFEDGTTDGWSRHVYPHNTIVAVSTATAHSGTHSLLVSGRIANYDGPQISVSDKMYPGSVYDISVWVKLVPTDNSTHIINMSLQTTLNGVTHYPNITPYPGVKIPADGNWHEINVMNYTMVNSYTPGQAYLYLQTAPSSGTDTVSFYIDDFQLTYVPPPSIQADIPSIDQVFSDYFPVGAAVDPSDLTGPHGQLLEKHFDSMTPGNELKWSSVEPSFENYNYTNADSEVGFAVCHHMLVRGQNLIWSDGESTPSYAFGDGTNSAANQAVVTKYIQQHIQSEVQHFGKNVYAWDVVNEPIDSSQPDCLQHGPFYKVLGPSYLAIALRAARQYAPPGTELFINQYGTSSPAILACLVKVVRQLRDQGVPLDGIGHEMHNNINSPSVQAMATSINTIAEDFPDLKQQVTELDESVYDAGDKTSNYGNDIPPSVLAEQGWLYKQYFDLFRRESKKGRLQAVTLWGMADDGTWLDSYPVTRTDYPLPFDMKLQAKPAYWGMVDASKLPGYGLHVSLTGQQGPRHARVLTFTATNGDVGTAYATQLEGLTFRQVEGHVCAPAITSPSFPISLGDIAASGTATASITVNFSHCGSLAAFVIKVPWSSSVYHTGQLREYLELREDPDDHGDDQYPGHPADGDRRNGYYSDRR